MIINNIKSFDQWREHARTLLLSDIPPESVHWQTENQNELFGENEGSSEINNERNHERKDQQKKTIKVNKEFIGLAKTVACYRDERRWALLYRTLWRLTHGEPYLLNIASDDDVRLLNKMEKEVRRDSHKMKAFVRFRKVVQTKAAQTEVAQENGKKEEIKELYIAWHQPSHLTLERTAPFFVRRFAAMNWAILTPDRCAYWNGEYLQLGDGVSRQDANTVRPTEDEMEDLWLTFYWNIFNPARIKVKMMKSEMPMKFWHTLPEAQLIPDMLNTASRRVDEMVERSLQNTGDR